MSFAGTFPGIDPPSTLAVFVGGPPARKPPRTDQERGNRAKLLAAQLEAWAQGHQEAFEIEYRLEAEAEAKLTAASKGSVGFSS